MRDTRVLLVNADALHCKVLTWLLEDHGYTVTGLNDRRAVSQAIGQQEIDLLLLEVPLPYQDGFALCDQLKRTHSDVPIVLIMDRHTPEEQVKGFLHGADECIARPYEPAELLARVQAVLRRYRRVERNRYGVLIKVGGTSLDLGRLTFRDAAGDEVTVTPTEMRILECLMRNAHLAISRERLIEQTWGYDSESADNRVDVYIRRLRDKIERRKQEPELIRTVRGVGYVYEGDEPLHEERA